MRELTIYKTINGISPLKAMSTFTARLTGDNTTSLPLSPDIDDAPPGPPNPGTACHSQWRRCKKVTAPQASCG